MKTARLICIKAPFSCLLHHTIRYYTIWYHYTIGHWHGSSLPMMRLDTFCSPRLVFITTPLGLMNRAQPLQRVVFSLVESQGAVIKRWYPRFWHAVAGPDLFRAFWGVEGLNLCWTPDSLCVERVDEWYTDVHIFGGATLVRVLLVILYEEAHHLSSCQDTQNYTMMWVFWKNIQFAVPSLWDLR